MRPRTARWFTRRVLLGPAPVRRAVARRSEPEAAWLLARPRPVRESYLREVVDQGEDERGRQIWMLRQDDATRDSYTAEVLARRDR